MESSLATVNAGGCEEDLQNKYPIQNIRSYESLGDMSSTSSENGHCFGGSDHFGYVSTRHLRHSYSYREEGDAFRDGR